MAVFLSLIQLVQHAFQTSADFVLTLTQAQIFGLQLLHLAGQSLQTPLAAATLIMAQRMVVFEQGLDLIQEGVDARIQQ